MNKIITASLLLASMLTYAEPIDAQKAKQVGQSFLLSKVNNQKAKSTVSLELAKVETMIPTKKDITLTQNLPEQPEEIPLYYIFNQGTEGFVIVSGNDNIIPILGYSTENNFDVNHIPANVSSVLGRYKAEIRYAIENNIQSADTQNEWKTLINGKVSQQKAQTAAVAPLLGEIKWDQSRYYNDSCPADPNADPLYGSRVPTGCIATAMAQIMKYWNYPTKGIGSKCYQADYGDGTNDFGNYGRLCADFGNATYNYSIMPNQLTATSSTAAKQAVAQLMYHCGVAVSMAYGPFVSISYDLIDDRDIGFPDEAGNPLMDARTAFNTYFGFLMPNGVEADNYSQSEWLSTLKQQLNANQPMIYSGENSTGHSFVCDGYDADDKFHFNFGWGGVYDGYFLVSNLVPNAPLGYDYTYFQRAIINIRKGTLSVSENEENNPIQIYPNPATDNLQIILPDEDRAVFILYDMQGKEVMKKEVTNQDNLKVTDLATGVYVYKVTTTTQSHQGKIMIGK